MRKETVLPDRIDRLTTSLIPIQFIEIITVSIGNFASLFSDSLVFSFKFRLVKRRYSRLLNITKALI